MCISLTCMCICLTDRKRSSTILILIHVNEMSEPYHNHHMCVTYKYKYYVLILNHNWDVTNHREWCLKLVIEPNNWVLMMSLPSSFVIMWDWEMLTFTPANTKIIDRSISKGIHKVCLFHGPVKNTVQMCYTTSQNSSVWSLFNTIPTYCNGQTCPLRAPYVWCMRARHTLVGRRTGRERCNKAADGRERVSGRSWKSETKCHGCVHGITQRNSNTVEAWSCVLCLTFRSKRTE